MRIEYTGLFGFLVLIGDLYAMVSVLNSNRSTGNKVLWIILVWALPFLGWVLWFFLGPRAEKS
jgi:hypothetical protein